MTPRVRVGVLVSGSGTNLQALLDAAARPDYPAQIVLVVSNVPGARALERARTAGVANAVVDHKDYAARADFDRALAATLTAHRVELVCLAGFMRLIGAPLLTAFPRRILNIHPALLPAFPGLHAVRQALAAGVAETGCTVHYVDEGVDTGPVILQARVPVHAGDDEAALQARIHEAEHRVYPEALRRICEQMVGGAQAPTV